MTPDYKRVMGLIGIAKKAGRAVPGTEMAKGAVRAKKKGAFLLLCSAEASPTTLKRIKNTAEYYKVPLYTLEIGKAELAKCMGKRDGELSVVAITDSGFAEAIAGCLTQGKYKQ